MVSDMAAEVQQDKNRDESLVLGILDAISIEAPTILSEKPDVLHLVRAEMTIRIWFWAEMTTDTNSRENPVKRESSFQNYRLNSMYYTVRQ